MLIEMCKSKIANGFITDAKLHYEGSITIDANLMKAVDILPSESVDVLNLNNGNRLRTYAIAGKAGSGEICLNGPAARMGLAGDQVVILSYALMDRQEAKNHKIKLIYLDAHNKIKS